jgi:hypothetical protein
LPPLRQLAVNMHELKSATNENTVDRAVGGVLFVPGSDKVPFDPPGTDHLNAYDQLIPSVS